MASDDEAAREAVAALAVASGFDALDAGPPSWAPTMEALGRLDIPFRRLPGRGTRIAPTWPAR